jgi:hypothetical protein
MTVAKMVRLQDNMNDILAFITAPRIRAERRRIDRQPKAVGPRVGLNETSGLGVSDAETLE